MADYLGENKYIEPNIENYLRIHLLEVKGGTPVLKSLFLKILRSSSANGDVDKYLSCFKVDIQRHKRASEYFEMLFPNRGCTNIDKWDVSLLAYVLVHCCTLEGQLNLKGTPNPRTILKREIEKHGNLCQFLSYRENKLNDLIITSKTTTQQYKTLYSQDHKTVDFVEWDIELVLQVLFKVCNDDLLSLQKLRTACKEVLSMQVEMLRTNIVLNDFLNHHQHIFDRLEKEKKMNNFQYKQIFPDKRDLNASNWDNEVLICVVVNTCQSLSQETCNDVKTIRTMRRELGTHTADTAITNDNFLDKWTDLFGAINSIATSEVPEIKIDMWEAIRHVRSCHLDIQSSVAYLTQWYDNQDTKYSTILETLSAIELNSAELKETFHKKIDDLTEKMDIILRSLPEPVYSKTRKVEELNVTINVHAENENTVHSAETSVFKAMKGIEDDDTEPLTVFTDKIKQMQTSDATDMAAIEKGSVVLVVNCSSLSGAHHMLKTLKSKELKNILVELQNKLSEMYRCPIRLAIQLAKSSCVKMSEMVVNIASQLEETRISQERSITEELLYEPSLRDETEEDTRIARVTSQKRSKTEILYEPSQRDEIGEASSHGVPNSKQPETEISSDIDKSRNDISDFDIWSPLTKPTVNDDLPGGLKVTKAGVPNPLQPETEISSDLNKPLYDISVSEGSTDNLCLPNKAKFKEMCKELRYKNTKLFKQNCENICNHIKSHSDKYVSVHTAYNANNVNEVVFVTCTNEDTLPSDISEYTLIHSHMNNCSKEGRDVAEHGKDTFLSPEDSSKLRKCLQKHSTRLLAEHSNLTMTSACLFKSKDYGTDKWVKNEMPCIVLYVMFKGYIPICEEPLPVELDGITVDVREGYFTFCGPRDYQEKLKQGSRISGVMTGTLSTFIDLNNRTCCLTSAHVLLGKLDMKRLTQGNISRQITVNDMYVYQPMRVRDISAIGNVTEAIYSPGDGDTAGYEIAVVNITSRNPECGRFPVEGMDSKGIIDDISRLRFTSGKICTLSQCTPGTEVIMFGSETGLNKGKVKFLGTCVDTRNIDFNVLNHKFLLNKQILVEPDNPNKEDIAKEGDSGALVFVPLLGNYSDLRALGIFEGQTADRYYIITPIWDIMEKLGHPNLMAFLDHTLESINDSEQQYDRRFNTLEQNVSIIGQDVKRIMEHLRIPSQ